MSFLDILTVDGGTDMLSRNVGDKIPIVPHKTPNERRPHLLSIESLKYLTVINLFNFVFTAKTGTVTETRKQLSKVRQFT
jgi:hypothetical protein